jgi:chloride channel 7
MLAGVFRSTISLTVILLEGTGQIQYLLPIILTIGVSKITADRFGDGLNEVRRLPIYERHSPLHSS